MAKQLQWPVPSSQESPLSPSKHAGKPLFDFGAAVHGWDEQMGQAFGLRILILPIEQCKVHLVLQ